MARNLLKYKYKKTDLPFFMIVVLTGLVTFIFAGQARRLHENDQRILELERQVEHLEQTGAHVH